MRGGCSGGAVSDFDQPDAAGESIAHYRLSPIAVGSDCPFTGDRYFP